MKQRFSYGLSLLAIVAVLSACGGGSGSAEPTVAPNAPAEAAQATTAPANNTNNGDQTANGDQAADDGAEASEQPAISEKAIEALDKLRSYATEMRLVVDGTNDAGTAVHYEYFMRQEFVREPFVRNLLVDFTSTDDTTQSGVMQMFETEGQMYMLSTTDGQEQCFSGQNNDPSSFESLMGPEDFLTNAQDATLVESNVEINGIKTDYYTASRDGHEAEMWIARDGGYLVKFQGEGDDSVELAAELKDAKYTWNYDLLDANNVQPSPVPDVCLNAGMADDVPVLADAAEKNIFGEAMVYSSQTSVADAKAYYETELAAAGWTIADGMDTEGTSHLQASKDGRTLTVMLSSEEGKTSVMLVETEQ